MRFVDVRTATVLVGEEGTAALALAADQPDPDSVAAGDALRRGFAPDLAAAALTQVALRRRARTKFGAGADELFLTSDGLQQATRPAVSAHRAHRLVAAGVRRVVDLGCGLGADALALADAGLEVIGVEADPVTAILARANAATRAARGSGSGNGSGSGPGPGDGTVEIRTGTAEELAPDLLTDPATAVFCDPARRDERGRVWRVEQFSPGWDLVTGLLDGVRPACVKLGPALPHALIPDGVAAEWVSHAGDVVEVALWAGPVGPGAAAGTRTASLLPAGLHPGPIERLIRTGPDPAAPVGPIGRFLHEPDGAAIRAGVVGQLATWTGSHLVDPQIAYLTSDTATDTPWLTSFAVTEVLPYSEKVLRRWVTEHRVGRLEIKKRGVEVDPAALRRRLRPAGPAEATLILTRTPDGTRVVAGRRVLPPQGRTG